MDDWRSKLEGVQKGLAAREQAEADAKADILRTFRTRLTELEKPLKDAESFGEAFGVEFDYEISRFDDRYPSVRYRIKRPLLVYVCECKDGAIFERLKQGEAAPTVRQVGLEALTPKAFGQTLDRFMQAAAEANRRPPGRGR